MSTEGMRPNGTNRRRFLACAAGALGVAAAPTPKDAVRKVPLDQVYASVNQSGLGRFPRITDWKEKVTAEWVTDIFKSVARNGSSNAFLVCGEGIEEAIGSTHRVLCCGADADTAYSEKDAPRPVWLAVFLGRAQMSPLEWTIEAVTVEGRQIRLTYRPRDRTEEVGVVPWLCSYDYWAPLPKLTPGVHAVELYDADAKAVTLSRRVKVER
jgi:hypothetical protein